MPVLIFLRQYGLREYAVTLACAAVVGLGIAVLINSAAGGAAGEPAILKTKQELADASSRVLTTRVYRPVAATKPIVRHRARHRARRHARRPHRSTPAPAPRVVAVRTPTPAPTPQRVVSTPVSTPAPKPTPVVHKPAPAPKPKPAPAPKKSGGGGSLQFDDSG
jgi:hypothetical protein